MPIIELPDCLFTSLASDTQNVFVSPPHNEEKRKDKESKRPGILRDLKWSLRKCRKLPEADPLVRK